MAGQFSLVGGKEGFIAFSQSEALWLIYVLRTFPNGLEIFLSH